MHAVGIERGERGLGRVFAAQIKPKLATGVAYQEFAAA
jgi:hypothetical protein